MSLYAREFKIYKDFTLLSELDFITTWDGRRNTLFANDVFSINPSLGLECGYKKIAFLRFGFGDFQKEILINNWSRRLNIFINISFKFFEVFYKHIN